MAPYLSERQWRTVREDYPIEQTIAKCRALLGKVAERSIDGLWNAIDQLLDTFPADGWARYLAHAGYART